MTVDPKTVDPQAVDPDDPETFEDDADTSLDVEAPEADAAEQHAELSPRSDEPVTLADPDAANEADRVEQARVVELNEDEYR